MKKHAHRDEIEELVAHDVGVTDARVRECVRTRSFERFVEARARGCATRRRHASSRTDGLIRDFQRDVDRRVDDGTVEGWFRVEGWFVRVRVRV